MQASDFTRERKDDGAMDGVRSSLEGGRPRQVQKRCSFEGPKHPLSDDGHQPSPYAEKPLERSSVHAQTNSADDLKSLVEEEKAVEVPPAKV